MEEKDSKTNSEYFELNTKIRKKYISLFLQGFLFIFSVFYIIDTQSLESLNGIFGFLPGIYPEHIVLHYLLYHFQLFLLSIFILYPISLILSKIFKKAFFYIFLIISSMAFFAFFIHNMSFAGVGFFELLLTVFTFYPLFFSLIVINILLSISVCTFLHIKRTKRLSSQEMYGIEP